MKSTAYQVFKIPEFRNYFIARLFFLFGLQMQTIIIQWQIYKITHDKLALGLIGLAEAIPFILTSLIGGSLADRIDRKRIIVSAVFIYLLCVIALLTMSYYHQYVFGTLGVLPFYGVIFISGIARGFLSPAQSAFSAQLVPREKLVEASTFTSIAWDIATIGGPAAGGFLYGLSQNAVLSYSIVLVFCTIGWLFFMNVPSKPMPEINNAETLKERLTAGFRFVFSTQIMLGALTLDMFAVLFGGAIAMLPAFADEVLHVGAEGLGVLRAAPSVGAILMAMIVARFSLKNNAGKKLLWAVAGFGLTMIGFALSKNFYLSAFLLLLSGMFDQVSVIIRFAIVQLYTPEEMRGRVSAVNGIFIGSSNEIGAFESGVAARLMGLVPSVIFGGCMTLLVILGIWRLAPKLRDLELK